MGIKEIRVAIEDTLSDPATSPQDVRLARQMQALDVRAQANSSEEARIAAKAQQWEAELKAIAERVGVPIGRALAANGVTKSTRILDLLPKKLHLGKHGGVGFYGKEGEGFGLDTLLTPGDKGNAFAALNLLRQAAAIGEGGYSGLKRDSVMGDITKLGSVSGIGAEGPRKAILKAIEVELPEPAPVVPVNTPRNHGLSPLGFLRRFAPSQRSR